MFATVFRRNPGASPLGLFVIGFGPLRLQSPKQTLVNS